VFGVTTGSMPNSFPSQTKPLRIGKPQAPTTDVLAQDLVLDTQVVDHVLLAAVEPTGYRSQ
jgi:hypothetical protein